MATPDLAPLLDPATVHRTVLPNGLTVLVRRDASAPVVAINTYVRAGYFDETDDVVGVAHVLEHMFFKGTPSRGVGEIAKQTKAQGGYLNAHTIYDHTSYYAVLPASGFVEGLDIQADAYANSLVDGAELAKELEVIIQEAKRKLDNAGAVTVETLYALLHDRHRIRRWRIGTEEGLRPLRHDDVAGFYRTYYRPRSTVLSIVGDVDPARALAEVEARYGALTDAPVPTDRGLAETDAPGFRYRELAGDVQRSQFAMGWRTPGTQHADTPALDLVGSVLGTGRGARLYRAVRERSLASHVSAYDSTPTELGVFTVHAEGDPERPPDAARAVWAELQALRADGVAPSELERVQRIAEARWMRRLESMEGQASWLAEWEALGDWRMGEAYRGSSSRRRPRSSPRPRVAGSIRSRPPRSSIGRKGRPSSRRMQRPGAHCSRRMRRPRSARARRPTSAHRPCTRAPRPRSASRRACTCTARRAACRSSCTASPTRGSCTWAPTCAAARSRSATPTPGSRC